MFLIVGLGNPGSNYENTRHNVGFKVVDAIAQEFSININKVKFKGIIGDGIYNGQKVVLLKPQTYMNLSGQSVVEVVNYYKIPLNQIIVAYDDLDLNLGKIRIRAEGSSGGHKGMDSIIYNLSNDGFCRLRIGIGKPPKELGAADYVLGRFPIEDIQVINEAIQVASQAALAVIEKGVDEAMNRFNGL